MNIPLVFGALIVLLLIGMMLFGPFFVSHDPYLSAYTVLPHYDAASKKMISPPFAPSAEYPIGSDMLGNDILSLIIYGARVTLVAAAYITLARLLLGVLLGSLAGWLPDSPVDRFILTLTGIATSIPLLLSSMILIFAFGIQKGLIVFIVALSLLGWTEIAQQVRGEVIVIRKKEYIEGARAVGLSSLQMVVRHVFPNLLSQMLVVTFLEMGAVLLLLAELGFLGVFIGGGSSFAMDPIYGEGQTLVETPEWGALLAKGTPNLRSYPFMVYGPIMAFFTAILGLNALGDGLRRLVEAQGLNTAVLLRKRTVVFAAAIVLVMILILDYTGPKTSYHRVAQAVDGQAVQTFAQTLAGLPDSEVEQTATEYLEQEFKALEMDRGVRQHVNSKFSETFEARLIRPAEEPRLSAANAGGEFGQEFAYGRDFGFLYGEFAGNGQVEGPLSVLAFRPPPSFRKKTSLSQMAGSLDLRDRIVMASERDLPVDFLEEATRLGALGILLVNEASQDSMASQTETIHVAGTEWQPARAPVFRIQPGVAEAILSREGLSLDSMMASMADPESPPYLKQDLEAELSMSLQVVESPPVAFPIASGFWAGYDMRLTGELIIIIANYDGLDEEAYNLEPVNGQSSPGMGVLLDMARVWKEENLHPRRSVLFIAWGAGPLGYFGARPYLEDWENFTLLPVLNRGQVNPTMVIQLSDQPAEGDGDAVRIDPNSAEELQDLFNECAESLDLKTEAVVSGVKLTERLPVLHLQWPDPKDDGAEGQEEPGGFEKFGKALSLTLINIVRQQVYWENGLFGF